MLVLATLCFMVGTSLGAAVGGMGPGNGGMMPGNGGMMLGGDNTTTPTICCMAQQWESTMVDLNAKDTLYALRFAHDDVTMREGYYIAMVGPGDNKPSMQVFKDFADKKAYTVNMAFADPKDYTCTVTALNEHFFEGCTHKDNTVHNMRFIGDATVGPASSGLHYDGWSFKVDNEMEITISMSRDGCVPLMESVKSQPGVFPAINSLLMYTNFVPKVVTKELMSIPAACVDAASGAVVG